jgi:hypothetical protein
MTSDGSVTQFCPLNTNYDLPTRKGAFNVVDSRAFKPKASMVSTVLEPEQFPHPVASS